LCTSCGGGKTEKEAKQIGKRAVSFFVEALGDNDINYFSTNFREYNRNSAFLY